MPANRRMTYDVRRINAALADSDSMTELGATHAPNLVTAFMRIAGKPVGVIGALCQVVQSLLWSATTFVPAWRGVSSVLFAGACFGGVCTGCVQIRLF